MKGKIINIFTISVIIIISIEVLSSSSSIIKTVQFSFKLWADNVFPSLFPFFVLSEMLIYYGFPKFLGELLKPIMYKLFKINGEASFVLFMSMLSGFPSSAKYTKELLDDGSINSDEASKLLMFTHFSNPLFILGTISILFLNNKEVGLLILISHYITNFIIGILFRNYMPSIKDNAKLSLNNAINKMEKKRLEKNNSFGKIFSNSVSKAINTCVLVLGIMTMFLVFTTVISDYLPLNDYYLTLINGTFEMTQGLKYVSLLDIPLQLKSVISTLFISFGGLSVHMQVISIISDTKIKYLPFLMARLLHAIIASLLVYLFFDIWITYTL